MRTNQVNTIGRLLRPSSNPSRAEPDQVGPDGTGWDRVELGGVRTPQPTPLRQTGDGRTQMGWAGVAKMKRGRCGRRSETGSDAKLERSV